MKDEETILTLYRIEDLLQELVGLMKLSQRAAIETAKTALLGRSRIRNAVYELCDGKHAVNQIAKKLKMKDPNVSRCIAELEESGLISVIPEGKQKYYAKVV